ncbi:hypothetical protein IQ238_28060 [Pleurocapsales cyanobacterium LEGE 06147]|nr:hypothetical protein [Pleurocapsales cyanobacterium LEGE 06147]
MKFADLLSTAREKIKAARWDRIIEKHEGPELWESVLKYYDVEFIEVEGRWILLPVDCSSHPNLTILRSIWSETGNSVTLFLKDTTYDDDPFCSGFIAVCDRVKDENFFLAIVYHEWFIIEPAEGVFES